MSSTMNPTQVRAKRLLDERATITKLHEDLVAYVEGRDPEDRQYTDVEESTLNRYRERAEVIDKELEGINEALEREERSLVSSKAVRSHLSGEARGVTTEDGQTKYRTFAAYARDKLIVTNDDIMSAAGGKEVREAARERLMRAPQHTLSSDVGGLIPPQHITQILEVIDASRPVIASSNRVTLERGSFTFPHVDAKPEVLLQATQKTEGGTAKMEVSMTTVTAKSFIGGGNLSWQAINWSTPDALQLWFNLAGEQYARKTEGTACAILTSCGTANRLGTADRISSSSTFEDWLQGVVKGFEEVYDNSQAMADTLYLSPDLFFAAAALTSTSGAMLISQGALNLSGLSGSIAGVRVVTSYGFGTATAIVGDSRAFLTAETAGAPVELRAIEPAIGGLEVGVIGAFAAQCYDDSRFSQVS